MKTRSMYKAERLSVDRISTLPQPIIETILCLLPTEEAARTSILSREWRYKWTTIPKLRFELSNRTSEEELTSDIANAMKYMDMYVIYRVLLLRQGPIHDLTIVMGDYWEHYDCFELELIMLHLSRKHTVKELALDGLDESEEMWYKLPESVFALRHLTDLYLCTFEIDYPSIFNGFGSLENLDLVYVKISAQTLLLLLSNSPLLKKLNLVSTHLNIRSHAMDFLNLSEYFIMLQHIDEPSDECTINESGDKCTINQLLKCLPVIEDLTVSGCVSEWLVRDSVPQELPTSLIHLKYLCLNQMCLDDGCGLAFVLALIKCSPNLEDVHLEIEWPLQEFPAVKDEYSDVWLEHLNELGICFPSNWLDTEFVKFILARSPKLKKVSILVAVDRKQESKMLKTLLRAPRASPGVKITTWRAGVRR